MKQENFIDILNQIKKGHKNAFSDLIKETITLAMTIAKNILFDSREVEDTVQDSYIKVWKNIGSYDSDRAQFTTWFYRIVQNECIDRNRKAKKLNQVQLSDDLKESGLGIDDLLHYKELKNNVLTISHSLPRKQREVFILRDVQNMTIEEVQKETGMSIGSIKTNLYLARKKIRKTMCREESKQ